MVTRIETYRRRSRRLTLARYLWALLLIAVVVTGNWPLLLWGAPTPVRLRIYPPIGNSRTTFRLTSWVPADEANRGLTLTWASGSRYDDCWARSCYLQWEGHLPPGTNTVVAELQTPTRTYRQVGRVEVGE